MTTAQRADSSQVIDYSQEVRFGVVMYGGVSLTLYINGVANELYEMAWSTPRQPRLPAPVPALPRTRQVYEKLSWLVADGPLRRWATKRLVDDGALPPLAELQAEAARRSALGQVPAQARLVVDVISGTSAGGINGIFLAKALANGQRFDVLKQLWVDEGDIGKLLNDKVSYADLQGVDDAQASKPRSLLNSARMYLKLLNAFGQMGAPQLAQGSPLVNQLDLFVTTTDIRGSVVPIRLSDKVVYEKRHKQHFHLRYADGLAPVNDFVDTQNAFLAFAARCTSSFPFAFEPMQVTAVTTLSPGVDVDAWLPRFSGLSQVDRDSGAWKLRAYGDGGYLDNKPFTYVVNALSRRFAEVPVDRKLIYVEPDPEHPERARPVTEQPNAVENALAALTSIPQYETIREDLLAVLERNRRVERVERIVRKVEEDIEQAQEDPFAKVVVRGGTVADWRDLDLGVMVEYYGAAYLPYRRIRVASVNDDLADRLAAWWGLSDQAERIYALRALVRCWRDDHYVDHKPEGEARPTINGFLFDFDLRYRQRRAGFLLHKSHQLQRLIRALAEGAGTDDETAGQLSDSARRMHQRLAARHRDLLAAAPADLARVLRLLRGGFATSLQHLRGLDEAPAPEAGPGTEGARDTVRLCQVLDLLLGHLPAEPQAAANGAPDAEAQAWHRLLVALCHRLPAIHPGRTLQENIFARAQALYAQTEPGAPVLLQTRLLADIEALRQVLHDAFMGTSPLPQANTSAREWLGEPRLVALPGDDGKLTQVGIEVHDVPASWGPELAGELNSTAGCLVRRFLAEYYLRFDEYDQMSFPLYYGTDTGEPSTVEVLRVSPEDATSLIDESSDAQQRRKLAGNAVAHFGGFLDAQWRRNDILWGRLDGCERLLAALLPDEADRPLREALLQEGQAIILREEMQPEVYQELVDRFAKALAVQPDFAQEMTREMGLVLGSNLRTSFSSLWQQLSMLDSTRSRQFGQALQALLQTPDLIGMVRQSYAVNRQLDTETQLLNATRAVTITGRMLEQIEQAQQLAGQHAVWITRLGRAAHALVAISLPDKPLYKLSRHWLALLYGFELMAFLAGTVLAAPQARTMALTALVITGIVHLGSIVITDIVARQHAGRLGVWRLRAVHALAVVGVLTIVGVTGLAAWGVHQVGWRGMVCGLPADRAQASALTSGLCSAMAALARP